MKSLYLKVKNEIRGNKDLLAPLDIGGEPLLILFSYLPENAYKIRIGSETREF